MHRFYIAPENWHPDALVLTGSEAHHCRNVLRLEPADKVVLFNGQGREITAEIVSSDTAEIRLRKLHDAQTPPLRCRITLGQAIPKGKNMDLIVQKAVEIGAAEIAPILSDRTVVRLDEESAASKQAKWQTVAIEAAKQCGQNWLPQVQTPQTARAILSGSSGFRSAIDRLAPIRRRASQENPRAICKRTWGPAQQRVDARRSRRRFHARRSFRSPGARAAGRSLWARSFFGLKPRRSIA